MTIHHQGRSIQVDWQQKKIKHIYLRIGRQGQVTVSSPLHTSEEKIRQFILSKADWILQKQQEQYHPAPGHLFLQGQQFALDEFAPLSEPEIIAAQAAAILPERFSFLCRLTGLSPKLQLKKMSGKYGFCLPKENRIALNPRLVMAPPACIDYVILHECMHLHIPNHGRDFHALVQRYLPNEQELRQELHRYPI